MNSKTPNIALKLFVAGLATHLMACSQDTGGASSSEPISTVIPVEEENTKASIYDLNLHPLNKTVCDPFNNQSSETIQNGLMASLYWLDSTQPHYSSYVDYITHGHKSEQSLFFADMNVPTRPFSEGFATQLNDALKDDQGNLLIEYFGLKFESVLKLTEDQPEGDYELALLSDDGSSLSVLVDGQWQQIIDNNGVHPTKMGCATTTLHFERDTEYPIEVLYYQGPRLHISNVLIWRQASEAGKDSQCGKSGNHLYFDPDHNSTPQQAFLNLQTRGWSIVAPGNFIIPQQVSYNPCVEGVAPVISNFKIEEVFSNEILLTFETDIPGTSQMKITNVNTGKITLTNNDNSFKTKHLVLLENLEADTQYKIQAISLSEDFGKGFSEELTISTTP